MPAKITDEMSLVENENVDIKFLDMITYLPGQVDACSMRTRRRLA